MCGNPVLLAAIVIARSVSDVAIQFNSILVIANEAKPMCGNPDPLRRLPIIHLSAFLFPILPPSLPLRINQFAPIEVAAPKRQQHYFA
jgi:hypothetical protein